MLPIWYWRGVPFLVVIVNTVTSAHFPFSNAFSSIFLMIFSRRDSSILIHEPITPDSFQTVSVTHFFDNASSRSAADSNSCFSNMFIQSISLNLRTVDWLLLLKTLYAFTFTAFANAVSASFLGYWTLAGVGVITL